MELNIQPIEVVFVLLGVLNGFVFNDHLIHIILGVWYLCVGLLSTFAINKLHKVVIFLHISTIIVFSSIIAPKILLIYLHSSIRSTWVSVFIPATVIMLELVVHLIALIEAIFKPTRLRIRKSLTNIDEEVSLIRWNNIRQMLRAHISYYILILMCILIVGACIQCQGWIGASIYLVLYACLLYATSLPLEDLAIEVQFMGLLWNVMVKIMPNPDTGFYPDLKISEIGIVAHAIVMFERCIEHKKLVDQQKEQKKIEQENLTQPAVAEESV